MPSIASIKKQIVEQLGAAGIETSETRCESELIIEHATGFKLAEQLAYPERSLTPEQTNAIEEIVAKRRTRMPLQYILGEAFFMGLPFWVQCGVLIPRPETEILVEQAIDLLTGSEAAVIADVGCGSGAIGLTIAKIFPRMVVYAIDISAVAIEVTRKNAEALGVLERVHFFHGDWKQFQADQPLDALISNPPYVPKELAEDLQPEVSVFEPHEALFGTEEDGLGLYRELSQFGGSLLRSGGFIALEMGAGQSEAVERIFACQPWHDVRVDHDLADIPRVLTARKS